MVPLLIAPGAGAASGSTSASRSSAAWSIGTLFTLFVTPAIYTFLAKDHQKLRLRAAAAAAPEAETPGEVDEATEAGMLFRPDAEPETAVGHSARLLRFFARNWPFQGPQPQAQSQIGFNGSPPRVNAASGGLMRRLLIFCDGSLDGESVFLVLHDGRAYVQVMKWPLVLEDQT